MKIEHQQIVCVNNDAGNKIQQTILLFHNIKMQCSSGQMISQP